MVRFNKSRTVGGSSKGKTPDSESVDGGSNPSPPAVKELINSELFCLYNEWVACHKRSFVALYKAKPYLIVFDAYL